jgi:hypothetical protein
MKEQLRMQMLAGIITESEYKAKLNEDSSNKLTLHLYAQNFPGNWKGVTLIDSILCAVAYSSTNDYVALRKYNPIKIDKFAMHHRDFSENEYEIVTSYLDKLNIQYNPNLFIKDASSYSNIETIFTKSIPSFVPKDTKFNPKILDFFIKRDNPKQIEGDPIYGNVYDFGGGENPIDEDDPQSIVVDLYLTPNQKKNSSKFIEADLSKYVKLPPKDGINIFSAVAQINSPNNLAKTIKHALKPGGLLVIKDHVGAVQDLLKYLKDFKLLAFGYIDVEDLDDITSSDQIFVTLKK